MKKQKNRIVKDGVKECGGREEEKEMKGNRVKNYR